MTDVTAEDEEPIVPQEEGKYVVVSPHVYYFHNIGNSCALFIVLDFCYLFRPRRGVC